MDWDKKKQFVGLYDLEKNSVINETEVGGDILSMDFHFGNLFINFIINKNL
jgi:hypothetical protein